MTIAIATLIIPDFHIICTLENLRNLTDHINCF